MTALLHLEPAFSGLFNSDSIFSKKINLSRFLKLGGGLEKCTASWFKS